MIWFFKIYRSRSDWFVRPSLTNIAVGMNFGDKLAFEILNQVTA